MPKTSIRDIPSSPWMIIVLLAVGWGPIFIAEFVRQARPDLAASYRPQGFAMDWLRITVTCSLFAIILALVHFVLFLVWAVRWRAD